MKKLTAVEIAGFTNFVTFTMLTEIIGCTAKGLEYKCYDSLKNQAAKITVWNLWKIALKVLNYKQQFAKMLGFTN